MAHRKDAKGAKEAKSDKRRRLAGLELGTLGVFAVNNSCFYILSVIS
jgi:hypothetical protein